MISGGIRTAVIGFSTALLLVLLILIGGYAAFPLLVSKLANWLAPQYGVEQVVVDAQRPGWSTWDLRRIELSTASQIVQAAGIRVTYDPVELTHGRLLAVEIARLEIVLKPSPEPDVQESRSLDPGLLAALPMQSLQVEELHFRAPAIPLVMDGKLEFGEDQLRFRLKASESPLNAPVRLTAKLDADGKFLARFHTSTDKEDHALEARGSLLDDSLAIAGSFDLGDYELALIAAIADVPAWVGFLRGEFDLQLDRDFSPQAAQSQLQFAVRPAAANKLQPLAMQGSLQWLPDPATAGGNLAVILDGLQVEGGSSLHGDVQHSDAANTADGSFVLSSGDLEALSQVFGVAGLKGDASGSFNVHAGPDLELANAEVEAAIRVALTYDGTTRLTSEHLAITHTASEPQQWLVAATPLEVHQQDEGTTVSWKTPEFKLTLQAADLLTFSMASKGDLSWQDDETRVLVNGLSLEGNGQSVAAGYTADVSLALQGQSIPLHVEVDEALDNWRFNGPLNWIVRQPLLVSTLGMQSDYDIVGGTFAGDVKGRLSGEALTADVQGSFKNGRLTYEDLVFSGFSSTVVAELLKDSTVHADLTDVSLASFDPGVPVTDVRTGITVRGDVINLSATTGKLLGGSFAIAPFTYDLAGGDATLKVDLSGVDLGAVLALEGKDLYGEGRLDGHIPVNIVDDTITVVDGTLRNTGNGVIRLASNLAQSVNQPGLDFALRALEDFQYETLEADIDYDVKGDLLAAIRLRGRNVKIEKGRPIHYNLNISENLPTLLASLRLQDEVNERVEKRVQQGVRR